MSDKDICTDNDWSISPFSQDDSSFDSLLSTTSNPRCNPYKTPATHVCPKLTNQQIYTETNQAMQHSITRWLKLNNKTPLQQQQPARNLTKLPTTKLRTKRQLQRTLQPPLHQLLVNDHWGDVPTKNPVHFRVISKNVSSLSTAGHNLLWRGVVHVMHELGAHVLCIQEPNLNWTDSIQ